MLDIIFIPLICVPCSPLPAACMLAHHGAEVAADGQIVSSSRLVLESGRVSAPSRSLRQSSLSDRTEAAPPVHLCLHLGPRRPPRDGAAPALAARKKQIISALLQKHPISCH